MTKPEDDGPLKPDAGGDSKKKKKRSRKKKTKKGSDDRSTGSSDDDRQPVVQTPQLPGTAVMNPHAILRKSLLAAGFSGADIDRAMSEMWDKDLPYDEFDAVVKYLKGEKEETAKELPTKAVDKPEAGGTAVASAKNGSAMDAPRENDQEEDKPAVKSAPPMTMEQKLEAVANFENLTDATFALTEWISKVAKPRDLEDLCATTKTDALVTVFRRSITESKDQSHFDNAILPAMVKLMDCLLAKSGISPSGVSETHRAFESLLKQARRTYLLENPEAQDFVDRVSRFIVSRLSLAIGESTTTMNNANGSAPQPPISTAGFKDTSVAQMLSKREIHMTAAKRYGVMLRSVCATFNSELGTTIATNGGNRETEIATSDIMLALLGEDANATFELQKADLEELKAQAKYRESVRAQELKTNIDELNEERETIGKRILELKQSIEKLETYDAELCVKVGDAQKELEEEAALASAEALSLNEKIKEASDAIKYGNSVLEVVDILKKYDDSLDKAIHTASKASFVPDADFAHKQMEVYLSHVRDYFQSEASTVDFLRDRIVASRKAVDDLKIDIIECEGLGMNTTIAQMKESVATKEDMIVKDTSMIERFTDDATSMFESLLARLEDYTSTQASSSVLPIKSGSLNGISSCLARIGVAHIDRLDTFMTSMNGRGHLTLNATDPIASPKVGAPVAPIGTPKSKDKSVVENPPTIPKFTWATAKASNDTGTKTSLLDIQQEELKAKETE